MTVKTIPALQVALIGGVMYGLAIWFPEGEFSFTGQGWLFLVTLIIAIGLLLSGAWSFKRANTTVNPIKPEQTTELVVTGIYRYSRNPMYLGFLLVLVAWGVLLANVFSFVMLPLFVWIITRFQILPEERVLIDKFGKSYQEYLKTVRRWL